MSKHTPGPWGAHLQSPDRRVFAMKRRFWEVGGGPDNRGVAFVFGDTEANALLIAAAPDLLEAALADQAAEDHFLTCDYCDELWCDDGLALYKRAKDLSRAATAKAEGRS